MSNGGRIDWQAVHDRIDRSRRAVASGGEPDPKRRAEILRARAAALAARSAGQDVGAASIPMLTFLLADERWALPLAAVAAVVRGRPLGPVPGAAGTVLGMLYERADVWMIHDLRRLLGLAPAAGDMPGYLLLLRGMPRPVGLRVDATGQIRRVDRLRPTPSDATPERHPMLLGLTDDAVPVLDAAALRSHPALTEVT